MNEIKTTLDLSGFKRFDADTATTTMKLSSSRIAICGKTDFLPDNLAVYVNPKGNIVVLCEEDNGYQVCNVKGAKILKGAGKVLSTLKTLGTVLPQKQDLNRDDDVNGWVARLDVSKPDTSLAGKKQYGKREA